MDSDDDNPAPPPARPSQVPSWVMLGFVLGALFVWALPKHESPEAKPVPAAEPFRPTPAPAPRITTIEAVFSLWGRYAVWNNDVTEVALWNPETNSFSDCYEVARVGDEVYFRSLTSLTRPLLTHGVPEGSPLQFTETAAQRAQWLADVQHENVKAFTDGMRSTFGAPTEEHPASK